MNRNYSKILFIILIALLFILIGFYLSIKVNKQSSTFNIKHLTTPSPAIVSLTIQPPPKSASHPKGAASNPTSSPAPTIVREKAYVNYVFDGDTIELKDKITLRLLGIDAPETANKYTLFKEECFASESAKIARELLMGQTIEIERDVEDKDKYGRILRYVWVDDIFVNEFLVRNGYAKVETKTINTKYKNILIDAESEAKRDGRGLWGKCQ